MLTIDHLLDIKDEDEQYTGCYRPTLGNGKIVNVELNRDTIWIVAGKVQRGWQKQSEN